MEFQGISLDQLDTIVRHVSEENYGGNLSLNSDAHDASSSRTVRCVARITAVSGKPGSRTTASGRRGPYACWHAHRDVLALVFEAHPDAKVKSSFATYDGAEGFRRNYPETQFHDVGSMLRPVNFGDLCECDD